MTAPASAKFQTLDLLPDVRHGLDRAGLRSIYRELIARARAAYVLKRSIVPNRLEQIDVRSLNTEANFKLAMTGEKLVLAFPSTDTTSAEVLRYYSNPSTDVPPRLAKLASVVSRLTSNQIDRSCSAYMILHDLEAILLVCPNDEPH